MKLKSVRIQNFKAIHDCSFDFTDATMLVGPNNSGKSSVLQAIHLASRTFAQATEANKQSTISLNEIEYIPSTNYRELAHFGLWGNVSGTPQSTISFSFYDPDDSTIRNASIVLKSARNEGVSVIPSMDAKLIPILRSKENVFSAYIPGIAGIPLQEEFLSKRHIFRKAASGDSNVVLRNVLLLIKKLGKLEELMTHVRGIYPTVSVDISFDEDKDYSIGSNVFIPGLKAVNKPLELSGTGFLQVLQIFSYLVLFHPKIILIDEPESHLHPTLQTKLIRQIQQRVHEIGAVALITTHSPFVARGLPIGSTTVWIDEGKVVAASSDSTIRDALGWGALDKQILLCTEDTLVPQLAAIVAQVETLSDKVSVFPFEGVSKLGSGGALARLRDALGGAHRLIVHRDRDCMTDEELKSWIDEYTKHKIESWITSGSDIEMYFCDDDYVSDAIGISVLEAKAIREDILTEDEEDFKVRFFNKRKEVNKKIYEKTGGSPNIETLWSSFDYTNKIRGKELMSKIREKAKAIGKNEKLIGRRAPNKVVAAELIAKLTTMLKN